MSVKLDPELFPEPELKLFEDFSPLDRKSWEERILKDLKNPEDPQKALGKLDWKTAEGFNLKPFYLADEKPAGLENHLPGKYPYLRSIQERANVWLTEQTLDFSLHHKDQELEDLLQEFYRHELGSIRILLNDAAYVSHAVQFCKRIDLDRIKLNLVNKTGNEPGDEEHAAEDALSDVDHAEASRVMKSLDVMAQNQRLAIVEIEAALPGFPDKLFGNFLLEQFKSLDVNSDGEIELKELAECCRRWRKIRRDKERSLERKEAKRLRREAHEKEGDEEAALLDEALAALGACSETHVHRIQTQQARAECALGSERYDEALDLFLEVAALREQIYAPLPHARVALDYFTLYEIANWQGDARTASHARERARWHLERTAAPDDRRLEDLHVAAAITSNQTADLAEGMIGFSVDDGGDWEAPPSDDDVWTPVERGSE